ncbi:hypothetical protein F7725_014256 [Dissostichus mawsoni]|uniref:Uncharacterized protein n=1 Tax=Dissostichus mawsoni TaxID=36200 RepID=A0A7J5YZR7_DISMA|nr:hypothetical protein F7725_014256 [Dissostichus mawsoni]
MQALELAPTRKVMEQEQEQVFQTTDMVLIPTVMEQEATTPRHTATDMALVTDRELTSELDMKIHTEGMEMDTVLVYNQTMQASGAKQMPYNGAPLVPAGIDGMSQFEPQTAGLGPNGKVGSMYGGMGGYGGQTPGMVAEKSNAKYGYAGNPYASAGQYGYGGLPNGGQYPGVGSNGKTAGKYGYERMPYEAQPAGISPEAKSAGTYGYGHGYNGGVQPDYASGPKQMPYNGAPIVPAGLDGMSQFEPQAAGLGPNGKLSSMYGGNQGQYQPQPYETASEDAGLPYEPLPLQPDSAVKSYGALVEGEGQTPEIAVEGEGMSLDRYEHVGYINGEVQPEVVEFPGVPTSSPTLAYPSDPSDPSYLPVEVFTPAAGVEDLSDPAGSDDLLLHSAPATETQGGAQPEDLLHQQEMPRQIHIQQHLKLHFHPKGKSSRGSK